MASQRERKVVRLVACDLDGTLIGPGDHGLEVACAAVQFAVRRGVNFTVATGRAFGSAERYLRELGIEGPAVTNNGSLVKALSAPPIWEASIDLGIASSVLVYLRNLGYPFYVITREGITTECDGPDTQTYSQAISYDIRVVEKGRALGVPPTQIALRVPPSRCDEVLSTLAKRWSGVLRVSRSFSHLIEIQALTGSKSSGLGHLAGMYGIDKEEVLAIGDGTNDVDMLMWAGIGACVENADEGLKSIAQIVAKGRYAEGVMEILKKTIVK